MSGPEPGRQARDATRGPVDHGMTDSGQLRPQVVSALATYGVLEREIMTDEGQVLELRLTAPDRPLVAAINMAARYQGSVEPLRPTSRPLGRNAVPTTTGSVIGDVADLTDAGSSALARSTGTSVRAQSDQSVRE